MINFENIYFSYDHNNFKCAINDVSFKILDKEWVSILGHNGSGKSTIAKLLIGLLEADKGKIFYDDLELNEKNVDKIRKRVGIVFQNPDNQFVGFNVKYDMAFGLENHQVPRNEMIELIAKYSKKVDMDKFLDREPYTLSGGQKQRVAIAGILAMNCDIIILDEATSMLDPKGTADIIDLIKELKSSYHKTIITITHDLTFASYSDRIIVLKEGKKIADDKPTEVFKNRELLLSSNLDLPFGLRIYEEAKDNEKLKDNKELMDALWEYHLTM